MILKFLKMGQFYFLTTLGPFLKKPLHIQLLGIMIEVKLEQLENAAPAIEVRESGRVIEVKREQQVNVLFLIEVREAGRVIEVKLEQS